MAYFNAALKILEERFRNVAFSKGHWRIDEGRQASGAGLPDYARICGTLETMAYKNNQISLLSRAIVNMDTMLKDKDVDNILKDNDTTVKVILEDAAELDYDTMLDELAYIIVKDMAKHMLATFKKKKKKKKVPGDVVATFILAERKTLIDGLDSRLWAHIKALEVGYD